MAICICIEPVTNDVDWFANITVKTFDVQIVPSDLFILDWKIRTVMDFMSFLYISQLATTFDSCLSWLAQQIQY